MSKKIVIVLGLIFLFSIRENLFSQEVYRSIESSVYDVTAASFSSGVNSIGGNPANLDMDSKEAGVQYNTWISDLFLISGQYSMPTFKNKKMEIANLISAGYLSSGKFEERDSNANLLNEFNYGQFLVSLLSSIDIRQIVLGVSVNYLSADKNYDSDFTIGFGVKYEFEYSDYIDIILGISVNNIMSGETDYILLKNMDNSIGLVYTSDDDVVMGVGVGYLSILDKNKIGVSLFYENMFGIDNGIKFLARIFATYSDYTEDVYEYDNSVLSKIKFGIKLDFNMFKLIYGYKNMGIAGNINSLAINFNI